MDDAHGRHRHGWEQGGLSVVFTAAAAPPLMRDAGPAEAQTPEKQLRAVVTDLSGSRRWSASAGTVCQPLGYALVFRPWPARSLHVVGQSLLAGEFRRLISSGGVPGWDLHPVPPGRTPLDVLAEPLLRLTGSRRFHNILERNGFAYVEEVAATPDECLLELQNSGPRLVAAVRAVVSELAPIGTVSITSAPGADRSSDGAPADAPVVLPPEITAAAQVLAAWGIAERGAQTLGDLVVPGAATAHMPPDVAHSWRCLAQLSLQPLAGPTPQPAHVARLADDLLDEIDQRCKLILTSRTFAPNRRTYDALALELGISRERVRQLEHSALIHLARATHDRRYAALRWRAASLAQHGNADPELTSAAPWMPKLLTWVATKACSTSKGRAVTPAITKAADQRAERVPQRHVRPVQT